MIDIPEARYALIASVVLLVLFAWWSVRSQFGIEGSLISPVWPRAEPPATGERDR
jgi:hypothetical protein